MRQNNNIGEGNVVGVGLRKYIVVRPEQHLASEVFSLISGLIMGNYSCVKCEEESEQLQFRVPPTFQVAGVDQLSPS